MVTGASTGICRGSSTIGSCTGSWVGSGGFAPVADTLIFDEKRMEGTINEALSIAGIIGADIPRVITFITSAFLMITE